ncbi:MAG: deoxyribodipyrimidine photo-lyase [Candidatus Eremiobacteraeota bacterium]|nr:deoxyribodipyrimidine photo-lyase [Candidatus Eremiobacteraeota bacterium]
MGGGRNAGRGIVWLRRDLRLQDNHAIWAAATQKSELALAFVLDPVLLQGPRVGAPLVQAFFSGLQSLREDLRRRNSDLALLQGDAADELTGLARRIDADTIYYNLDYEPEAILRDQRVERELHRAGLRTQAFCDHVYFAADEVLRDDGSPYRVFTPYKRRWLDRRAIDRRQPFPSAEQLEGRLVDPQTIGVTRDAPQPEDWKHRSSAAYPSAGEALALRLLDRFLKERIGRYREQRDIPSVNGTSQLSPQLRAGTIGIRTCVERASSLIARGDSTADLSVMAWISELIWRDFYQMVLATWPHVTTGPFVAAAEAIAWRSSQTDFEAWCEGRTGIPIVDAGMRQLNATGWMHNRLRMIVASFLSKHLLTDWRWGERYFERHLADADVAQNNGGWQWSASTGTDAAPFFRIFNPVVQSRRFDPDGEFIRAWIPELAKVPSEYVHAPWQMPPLIAQAANCRIGVEYPAPVVSPEAGRERALAAFAPLMKRRDKA